MREHLRLVRSAVLTPAAYFGSLASPRSLRPPARFFLWNALTYAGVRLAAAAAAQALSLPPPHPFLRLFGEEALLPRATGAGWFFVGASFALVCVVALACTAGLHAGVRVAGGRAGIAATAHAVAAGSAWLWVLCAGILLFLVPGAGPVLYALCLAVCAGGWSACAFLGLTRLHALSRTSAALAVAAPLTAVAACGCGIAGAFLWLLARLSR